MFAWSCSQNDPENLETCPSLDITRLNATIDAVLGFEEWRSSKSISVTAREDGIGSSSTVSVVVSDKNLLRHDKRSILVIRNALAVLYLTFEDSASLNVPDG